MTISKKPATNTTFVAVRNVSSDSMASVQVLEVTTFASVNVTNVCGGTWKIIVKGSFGVDQVDPILFKPSDL